MRKLERETGELWVLETMNALLSSHGTWTVLGNDTTNLAVTTNRTRGAKAIEFDKANGAANTKLAGVYNTVDLNLAENSDPSDFICMDLYVSAITNIDYAFIRIGTSASHYVEYRVSGTELNAGEFTLVKRPLRAFTASATAGNGCDFNNVDYMVVGVAFDAESDTLADIAVDMVCIDPSGSDGSSTEAEVELDSEGVPDAAAPSHALQVGAAANAAAPTPDEGDMGALSQTLTSELRARLDLAQAVPDAAAPAQAVQTGAVANAAAPTPDEGDLGALSQTLTSELRTRLDLAQGVVDAAAPAQVVVVGGVAETTVPTAVADGDIVNDNRDEYGRARDAAFDQAENAGRVIDVAPALIQKLTPGAQTTLTAPGSTAPINIEEHSNFSWQIVIAAIDTSVDIRIEVSNDGTSWMNADDSGVDTQYTANGPYELRASNRSNKKMRLTFVSEVGGTAATVTATPIAGN